MAKKLTDNHPAAKAFAELCSKADELGVSLYFEAGYLILKHGGGEFQVEDIESPGENYDFPPVTEYKILVKE